MLSGESHQNIMSRTILRRITASGAFLLLGGLSLLAQNTSEQLYGITFLDNQLIAIDPATGQGALVGPLNAVVSGYGIAAGMGVSTLSTRIRTKLSRSIRPRKNLAIQSISA
jgi:hypothetical protein